ncbi:hypothetical protein D3C72_692970 [compost metagenome]
MDRKKSALLLRDKNIDPEKVAILSAFLFYRYNFHVPSQGQELVPIARMDKNMSRLPIR